MKLQLTLRTRISTAVCASLLLLVILAALVRRPVATQPLPSVDHVILLLAPGATLSDWSDKSTTPALAALIDQSPHGVFPTRTDETPATLEDPIISAAHMIDTGDRMPPHLPPTLAEILRRSGIEVVTLANEDSAARAVAELSRPDPLTIDQPTWRKPDASFPDGVITDPDDFVKALETTMLSRPPTGNPVGASSPAFRGRPSMARASNAAAPAPISKILVVATFDDIYRADQYAPLALPAATRAERAQALARLDRVVANFTSANSPQRLGDSESLIIVSPTVSGEALQHNERLGPILFWSAAASGKSGQLLTSPSTRATPGLIAGTDLAATIAATFGLSPSRQHIGEGRAARLIADDGRLPDRILAWDAQEGQQKLLIYVPWVLAVLLIAASWLASHGLRAAATCGAGAAFYPAALLIAANLVPNEIAPVAVYLLAALPSLAIAGLAGSPAMRRDKPRILLGFVGLVTVLTITLDILTGSHLLARTPLSYSPMEAARFYGVGNEAAGALIGAALLAAAVFVEDIAAWTIAFALFAAAICLTIALPQFGAKAGSLTGALTGFGAFYVLRSSAASGQRPNIKLIATIAAGALAVFVAYVIFEGTRGAASRTHVGEAMAAAHQHGFGALATIAKRKFTMDLHLMVTSPWAALLLTEAALIAWSWRRIASRWRGDDHAAMFAFAVAGAVLLFFNDAGVVGAATCLLFAVPFALLPSRPRGVGEKQVD